MNIPIFRAKKIDSNEYVEGFYYKDGKDHIIFNGDSTTIFGLRVIDPTTLAIHFPDMIDSQGNKIFTSLQEFGKGGDTIKDKKMIDLNNPFEVNYENGIEDNITVQCDNCRHYTILPYYYDKDLDIERETARIKHHYKDNDRIKLQCKLIPEIYKKYRRHPEKIIAKLISSYWSAWDYDVANDNGVNNLIGHCYNCNKLLKHERLAVIKGIN